MSQLLVRCVGFVQVTLLLVSGAALADGGALTTAQTGKDRVIARATYNCKGGVRVQVTVRPDTARVDFAGQTQTLNLTPDANGGHYQNTQVAWFTKGKKSYMQDKGSGQIELSDCVQEK